MPHWQMYFLAVARLQCRKESRGARRKSLCGNELRRGSRYPLKMSRFLPFWHGGAFGMGFAVATRRKSLRCKGLRHFLRIKVVVKSYHTRVYTTY